nr:tyrosine-type recombinase/integrase [Sporotomaculum syntrophicum]
MRPASDIDLLLIGQRGALKRNAINLILKKYGQRVVVEVSAHMCRHSLSYNIVKQNVPIATIQQILGHDFIQTTNIYTPQLSKIS